MFFVINKIEQAVHHADGLQNPKNPGNPMVLGVYRQLTRTALFNVHSKKAFGEFWDSTAQKKIGRRLWSSDMKAFAAGKVAEAPKPPYVFKLTIIGWLFVLIMTSVLVMLVYESVKPPAPKSSAYVAMEQAPVVGDIYFGRFEAFNEPESRIASEIGFGWFKVVKVDGEFYYLAKSTGMSKRYQPKEQLNQTEFESEGVPVKITEQAGYMINMKSTDGTMEIYITDKK